LLILPVVLLVRQFAACSETRISGIVSQSPQPSELSDKPGKNTNNQRRRISVMKKENCRNILRLIFPLLVLMLGVTAAYAASASQGAEQAAAAGPDKLAVQQPMEIPDKAPCGKCGMYPAQYPRWQAQIIFKDGTMTPFDGCKCLYNFLFAMEKFDQKHSRDDVEVAWVKDFNSGAWINAADAYYVVGSNMMGPMGKELIPFADQAAAKEFSGEQGGTLMAYGDITPDVLKTLGMGGMKMEQGAKQMKM
jgi:copper chaperone NosL